MEDKSSKEEVYLCANTHARGQKGAKIQAAMFPSKTVYIYIFFYRVLHLEATLVVYLLQPPSQCMNKGRSMRERMRKLSNFSSLTSYLRRSNTPIFKYIQKYFLKLNINIFEKIVFVIPPTSKMVYIAKY